MNQEKWQKLSLAGQMGNIGSEANRAFGWQEKNDKESAQAAAKRVLELIDLTLTDVRWAGRQKEISRLREVFCDYFWGNNQYNLLPDKLKEYFLNFARVA